MTSTLHDAIAAVRAGDTERAQLLAADIVQNNPNDPNAWYLLSQLVDSDARRAAYLSKTLSLDPDHPRASIEFAALPPGLAGYAGRPVAVASPPVGEIEVTDEMIGAAAARVEAAAREREAEELATMEAASIAAESVEETFDEEAAVDEVYINESTVEEPYINESTVEEPYVEELVTEPLVIQGVETEEVVSATPATGSAPEWLQPLGPQPVAAQPAADRPAARPAPAAASRRAPARKGDNRALTLLLGVLGVLTILVLAVLAYLLLF